MSLGINETTELIDGLVAAGMELKKVLADGFQFDDISQLFDDYDKNPDLKAKLDAAIGNIQQVIPELQDLDFFEMITLGRKLIAIAKLLKA